MGAINKAGYPYPVGTDRVMDGDDAIKALAAAIPWVQSGSVGLPASVGGAASSVVVTFPKAFPGIPAATVTPATAASVSTITQSWSIQSITATTLGISQTRSNTTVVNMRWIAIYTGGNIPT